MNSDWLVDMSKFYKMVEDLGLSTKDLNLAMRRGLAVAAGTIKREAKKRLKALVYKNGAIKNADFLAKAIKISVKKNGRSATIGLTGKSVLKIKGNTYQNPSHILIWIERGTKQRSISGQTLYYHKKANRGIMPASHFFSGAVEAKKDEAQNMLGQIIENQIIKIANKKG